MSVVRRIAVGQDHRSAAVLNQPTDDILTLSGLTLGDTFPGFEQMSVGDVRQFATPNAGVTALAALGGGTLIVPRGYTLTVTVPIDLVDTVNLRIDGKIIAGAAMNAVVQTPLSTVVRYMDISGHGTIDCADLATSGIHARYFGHVEVSDLTIERPALYGLHFGDAGAPGTSFEGMVSDVLVVRRSTHSAIPAGSIGIYYENCGDSEVDTAVVVGSQTGVKTNNDNSRFRGVHCWAYASTGWMTTAFDDNGVENEWHACYADTPQTYGFRVRKQYTLILGGKVYNNNISGADNVVTAVFFDTTAPLGCAVLMLAIKGQDITHRIAADYVCTDDSNLIWSPASRLFCVTTHDSYYGQALGVKGAFNSSYFRLGSMTFWVESSGVTRCILGLPGSNTAGRLFAVGSADVVAKSANYTALSTDHAVALRYTTAASALVLTVATTLPIGWRITVTKVDSGAGTVTISGTSCTFNSVGATGAASLAISTQWKGYTIVHVGSGVFDVIAAT